jgi:hypothetical protein
MVIRTCERCLKEFKLKGDYTRHINRKIPCISNVNLINQLNPDESIIINTTTHVNPYESIIINTATHVNPDESIFINTATQLNPDESIFINTATQLNPDESIIINTATHVNPDESIIINTATQVNPDESIIINTATQLNPNKKKHHCIFCKKEFSTNSNMHKHIKSHCKIKRIDNRLKEELFTKLVEQEMIIKEQHEKLAKKTRINKKRAKQINELEEKEKIRQVEINELQDQIKNLQQQVTIYNNTTNNTMNNNFNIKIVAFGTEELTTYITEKMLKHILGRGFKSLEHLIEHVHFNKNKPEYHNIYLPSTKESHVMCYNGKRWKLEHSDEKIRELIDDKETYLVDEYDKLKDKLSAGDKKKFERFMASLEDDKQNKIRKGDIKLLLYNNRELVKETRRKVKENKTLEENKVEILEL